MSEASYSMEHTRYGDLEMVVATVRGAASFDVITRLVRELDALAALGVRHMLVDETQLGPGMITADEIRVIAETWQQANALSNVKIAVLAPSLVIYGLNRMAHAFAGEHRNKRLAVFREREKALEWLASS